MKYSSADVHDFLKRIESSFGEKIVLLILSYFLNRERLLTFLDGLLDWLELRAKDTPTPIDDEIIHTIREALLPDDANDFDDHV